MTNCYNQVRILLLRPSSSSSSRSTIASNLQVVDITSTASCKKSTPSLSVKLSQRRYCSSTSTNHLLLDQDGPLPELLSQQPSHAISQQQLPTPAGPRKDLINDATNRNKNSTVYTPSNIQLISDGLHAQIFIDSIRLQPNNYHAHLVQKCQSHLQKHSLWGQSVPPAPPVDFRLPQLEGTSIDEHFQNIALQQTFKYRKLLSSLEGQIPEMPANWVFQVGWTKYSHGEPPASVPFPDGKAFVFDIETCVRNGPLPVMACVVSSNAWYSWCSTSLIDGTDRSPTEKIGLADLIPMETDPCDYNQGRTDWTEKIIVGHNVSFDRARIKEQYYLKQTKLKFIDTMSLHIAVSGITSFQRVLKMTMKDGLAGLPVGKREELMQAGSLEWNDISSLNNLKDVHKLYCEGAERVDKETRNVFVKGNIQEIRADFQNLMTYCAKDVRATQQILSKIMPLFYERFPHPVTFAGMLEMGMPYLPINSNWNKYLASSEQLFQTLENEMKSLLMEKADEALKLLENDKYKEDPWLWDLDWKVPKVRKKKVVKAAGGDSKKGSKNKTDDSTMASTVEESTATSMPVDLNIHAGQPAWYRKLFYKKTDEDYIPGPAKISTSMQIIPKLLRLCWFGFPLHYTREGGWGYLIKKPEVQKVMASTEAGKEESENTGYHIYEGDEEEQGQEGAEADVPEVGGAGDGQLKKFPYEQWELIWNRNKSRLLQRLTQHQHNTNARARASSGRNMELSTTEEMKCKGEEAVQEIADFLKGLDSITHLGLRKGKAKKSAVQKKPSTAGAALSASCSPHPNCEFRPLPHKDGANFRVGNPLAKDFLNKMEDGILTSESGESVANKLVRLSKMVSYWRNNKDRIMGQIAVWTRAGEDGSDHGDELGAILPQVSVAGTLTRRAVERTWLTASNAYEDRVGSELKGMIQAPPGYSFVGADVDSQELWIASILGDAKFTGFHGSTALGWMTLQGNKASGTDMHSKTASLIGISRDQAKILNYGRIYGAGLAFAQRLLEQFNHELSSAQAKEKAAAIYKMTKGERKYLLNDEGKSLASSVPEFAEKLDEPITREQLRHLMKSLHYPPVNYMELVDKLIWDGGTESEMFNRLEEIAQMDCPLTPILDCCISRALVPSMVQNDFMTSRVNWVVQSSAVDYLHLMLTNMAWLIEKYEIKARFVISVHDEVRYLVAAEDRYRAALALQITNLLTRAQCSYQLGMNDLPQSVAFFSCIDIDQVLRKEVTHDCQTPSNPTGLTKGYNIGHGEALDIYQLLELTKGKLDAVVEKVAIKMRMSGEVEVPEAGGAGTSTTTAAAPAPVPTHPQQIKVSNPYAPYI